MSKKLKILKIVDPPNTKKKALHPNLPQPPSLVLMIMPTKTGKSTIISNMLLNKDFYGQDFFDETTMISTTINNDQTSRFMKQAFNTYDYYSISYGIRNVTDINKALKEAHRVLKPGGRFMCLEFSKIDNETLNFLYRQYSKAIPLIGKYVVGYSEPYEYLIKSIDQFYSQNQLIELMINNGFYNTEYRNLSNGVSAIHSGWKI